MNDLIKADARGVDILPTPQTVFPLAGYLENTTDLQEFFPRITNEIVLESRNEDAISFNNGFFNSNFDANSNMNCRPFYDLTEKEIGTIDYEVLKSLMVASSLTKEQQDEVKLLRKRIKNRLSAFNYSKNRKNTTISLADQNTSLIQRVALLEKRNAELETHVENLNFAHKDCPIERSYMLLEISRLTNYITKNGESIFSSASHSA